MIAGIRGPSFAVKFPGKGVLMQAAYHETFDVDDPVPVGSFVPVVDELRELRDIMPYRNAYQKMQRWVIQFRFFLSQITMQLKKN